MRASPSLERASDRQSASRGGRRAREESMTITLSSERSGRVPALGQILAFGTIMSEGGWERIKVERQ